MASRETFITQQLGNAGSRCRRRWRRVASRAVWRSLVNEVIGAEAKSGIGSGTSSLAYGATPATHEPIISRRIIKNSRLVHVVPQRMRN